MQEIAPGEFAPEAYVVTAVSAAVLQQRFFLAGSGRLTLAVAGNMRGVFTNPSGSGRRVSLVRVAAVSTVMAWMDLRLTPTTGIPASTRTPFNAVLGGAAPVATLAADTNATTAVGGGTLLSSTLALPANARQSIDLPPIVMSPGVSLGMNINLIAAADGSFSLYWIEDDL